MKNTESCKYYHIYKWGEPPLEPDENGTIETEIHCTIKKGYPLTACSGDLDLCDQLIRKSEIISLIDGMIKKSRKNRQKYLYDSGYGVEQKYFEEVAYTVALTELKGKL